MGPLLIGVRARPARRGLGDRRVTGGTRLRPRHRDDQRPGGLWSRGLLGDDRGASRPGRMPSAHRLGTADGGDGRTRGAGRRGSGGAGGGTAAGAEQRGVPAPRFGGRGRIRASGPVAAAGRRRRPCRSLGAAAGGLGRGDRLDGGRRGVVPRRDASPRRGGRRGTRGDGRSVPLALPGRHLLPPPGRGRRRVARGPAGTTWVGEVRAGGRPVRQHDVRSRDVAAGGALFTCPSRARRRPRARLRIDRTGRSHHRTGGPGHGWVDADPAVRGHHARGRPARPRRCRRDPDPADRTRRPDRTRSEEP